MASIEATAHVCAVLWRHFGFRSITCDLKPARRAFKSLSYLHSMGQYSVLLQFSWVCDAGIENTTYSGYLSEMDNQFPECPRSTFPKGQCRMRGRSITAENTNGCSNCARVRPKYATSWQHYMMGLWLFGLRPGIAGLSWDQDVPLSSDLSGRRPRLRSLRRGRRKSDRLLSMTPDFAKFLLSTREAERRGQVDA